MTRDVQQGDPLSPVVFNILMHELLHRIGHNSGDEIDCTRVSVASYADDLLIMGPFIDDTQITVNSVTKFLQECNLQLNIAKYTALTMARVPKKKKLCCLSAPSYYINNIPIPGITVDKQFKYLGRNFDFSGMEKLDVTMLANAMVALFRCPLKPFHKMIMSNRHLFPKFLHDIQYFEIT